MQHRHPDKCLTNDAAAEPNNAGSYSIAALIPAPSDAGVAGKKRHEAA